MQNTENLQLESTYSTLPKELFSFQEPRKAQNPELILFNSQLAKELQFPISDKNILTQLLSGNNILENTTPLAQAYAGHQFGHPNILGDGRAVLLGEYITAKNQRIDIQLKGSGRTPYSRNGDGRATFYSMLREYLISEAMFHLGIPTSRSLAVTNTGEKVYREITHEGAILTRLASSHIRVGTFEFAARTKNKDILESLFKYTAQRHFPEVLEAEHPAVSFLEKVMEKQVSLIVQWMNVGFIHGVMNTDNMFISGETLDYGPCAFMNTYDPTTVFSSIDRKSRYAFGNQPRIGLWNLSRLAETLLPLFSDDTEKAVEIANNVLEKYSDLYITGWNNQLHKKLGFLETSEETQKLSVDILSWMQENKADYTNTFRGLLDTEILLTESIYQKEDFKNWLSKWKEITSYKKEQSNTLLQTNNPFVIARNNIVEEVLEEAVLNQNLTPFLNFLEILKKPYTSQNTNKEYLFPPKSYDEKYMTFCGT